MFVHVKMITRPEKGKQKIVSTEDLSHFHKEKHHPTVKYTIKSKNKNDPESSCIITLLASNNFYFLCNILYLHM